MSFDAFATNVSTLEGLADRLRQAARAELGAATEDAEVDKRASRLLVECMDWVGINAKTELDTRNLIFDALRGEPLNDKSTMQLVEYVLGQMIAKPKGALGERLAKISCAAKIAELQRSDLLPPDTQYLASTWSKRLSPARDGSGTTEVADWRDGADGVVYCHPGSHSVEDLLTATPKEVAEDSVIVLGIVEVKARRTLPAGEPKLQLDKHLARLTLGLQTRDKRNVVMHIPPERLYFAQWENGAFKAVAASDVQFRLETTPKGNDWHVNWGTPMPTLQWAIGPRPSIQSRRASRFDGFLPYTAAELEQFGNDVMHYTLGAMADDEGIDERTGKRRVSISGAEWSFYLERLLDCVDPKVLNRSQRIRLEKLLAWLRE